MNWIIGSTSEYSKAVAQQLGDVKLFGRHNIDYTDASMKCFSDQELPERVFINIGVEDSMGTHYWGGSGGAYWHSTIEWKWDTIPKTNWSEGFADYSTYLFWRKRLYDMLSDYTTVCDVTSSITLWPHKDIASQQYAMMRSMQQTLAHSYAERLRIFAVCPNGISTDNAEDYARLTVNLMNRSPEQYAIYNLSDGGTQL